MVQLGVNIDHVATLRQARRTSYPDPVLAASLAELAGADGITVHLREDRRHIQEHDVEQLLKILQIKLNLEMAATSEMTDLACRLRPAECCLVPERREEVTTEGGLDVVRHHKQISSTVNQLKQAGIHVSLFIDPEFDQIVAAAETGTRSVEFHTGAYANSTNNDHRLYELEKLKIAFVQASAKGLITNAGHGLNYHNVQEVAAIPGLNELNIGHAIIARAVFVGIERAVRDMKQLIHDHAKYSREWP
ncbi:MAG: pyridoxine 5'-phosphate synthase [Magnetococcales bacterium]|nr:pyridoxine 5'-phosphate synthase [Magnetococcales bacterium]